MSCWCVRMKAIEVRNLKVIRWWRLIRSREEEMKGILI